MTFTDQHIGTLMGATAYDNDGDKIGKVGQVYLDDQTGAPEWVSVNTGLFGTGESFIPLADARMDGDRVVVPYEKARVKDAPNIDPAAEGGALTQEQEAELYRYYGLSYSESQSDSGLPAGGTGYTETATTGTTGYTDTDTTRGAGHDTSGPNTDDAMTRSEEQLRVGTETREAGRARLRKYVVTENVQTTVPVSREEVRIEREPITDANRDAAYSGADITEEEHEVTLHEEEVVTEKRAVPKERVRLDKDTVTEEQTVSEEVRKEQIETDAGTGGRGDVTKGFE